MTSSPVGGGSSSRNVHSFPTHQPSSSNETSPQVEQNTMERASSLHSSRTPEFFRSLRTAISREYREKQIKKSQASHQIWKDLVAILLSANFLTMNNDLAEIENAPAKLQEKGFSLDHLDDDPRGILKGIFKGKSPPSKEDEYTEKLDNWMNTRHPNAVKFAAEKLAENSMQEDIRYSFWMTWDKNVQPFKVSLKRIAEMDLDLRDFLTKLDVPEEKVDVNKFKKDTLPAIVSKLKTMGYDILGRDLNPLNSSHPDDPALAIKPDDKLSEILSERTEKSREFYEVFPILEKAVNEMKA